MFVGQAVLFAHRAGDVIEYFGRSVPDFHLISVNTAPDQPVDTLELPPARYSTADIEAFRPIHSLLRRAIRTGEVRLLGRAATASAVINERYLPKPAFPELRRIAECHGAVGIQVAHSGTMAGLIFDRQDDRSPSHIEEASKALVTLGFRPVTLSSMELGDDAITL